MLKRTLSTLWEAQVSKNQFHLLANLEHKKWLNFQENQASYCKDSSRSCHHWAFGHDLWSKNTNNNINHAIKSTSSTICWKPPPSRVKVNFDGSVKNDNKNGMGFVIRDYHGSPRFASTKNLGWTNVLSAEAFALREGLSQALGKGYRKVLVEGETY